LTLQLHYYPGNASLAPHMLLEELGVPFELKLVDRAKDAQRSPEYLKLNPKGRVPALVTERGVLTETPAILLYIAQCFPQAKLAPFDDPWALAQLNAFCSYLCSTVHVAHAHGRRGARWADDPAAWEAMKAKVPQTVGDGFAMIEAEYLQGPWAMGEHYSIADPYLYTLATWMEGDGVDPARFPKVAAHRARMAALPAVQKVLAAEA
jgi:glutathione S-transferase